MVLMSRSQLGKLSTYSKKFLSNSFSLTGNRRTDGRSEHGEYSTNPKLFWVVQFKLLHVTPQAAHACLTSDLHTRVLKSKI